LLYADYSNERSPEIQFQVPRVPAMNEYAYSFIPTIEAETL